MYAAESHCPRWFFISLTFAAKGVSLPRVISEVTAVKKVKDPIPVEDYLKTQSRFQHLFKMEGGDKEIALIQQVADRNIAKYGLNK